MSLEYIVLKLGGSIITRKSSASPVLRASLVRELGKSLKSARKNNKNLRIILLHGAGSFGHPLAHKYQLKNQPMTSKKLEGVSRTVTSMKNLSLRLATIFHEVGLPIIPIQTSSVVIMDNKEPAILNLEFINTILNNNGVPLLGGDVIIDKSNYSRIVSADKLVALFAQAYPSSKVLLASDVEGVYPSFPPKKGDKILYLLKRSDIIHIKNVNFKDPNCKDVTGAMSGKLQELLSIHNRQVYIFDGRDPNNLECLLQGKQVGTLVEL